MNRQRMEPAYTLGAVFTASMVLAAVLGNERVPAVVATVVFAAVAGAVAVRSRPVAAVVGAVIAWSMLTGFAVNRLGALSFHSGDLGRLALLAAVALAGSVLARRLGPGQRPYPVDAPRRVQGPVPSGRVPAASQR